MSVDLSRVAAFLADTQLPVTATRTNEVPGYKIASVDSARPATGSVTEVEGFLRETLEQRNLVGAVGLKLEHETPLVFVDLDGDEAREFYGTFGAPKTFVVKSGKGWHLWFFAPPVCERPKIEFEAGGDSIKLSTKGYGLLPGSWHAELQTHYKIFHDRPVVMLPQEVYDAICQASGRTKARAKQRVDAAVNTGKLIKVGERDNTITAYAGYMASAGFPQQTTLIACQDLALNHCEGTPAELEKWAMDVLPAKVQRWYREWDHPDILDPFPIADYFSAVVDPEPKAVARQPKLTEDGMADHFVRVHGQNFRYHLESKTWIVFKDGRWHREATHSARKACEKLHRDVYKDHAEALPDGDPYKEAAEKFSNQRAIRQPRDNTLNIAESRLLIRTRQLDAHPRLLAVGNGVLDLTVGTYTLREGKPNDYLTIGSSVDYTPGAECPKWRQFIDDVTCGNRDLARYLQRFAGNCLTGDVDDQQFYVWLGPGGSNGKDTFANLLIRVLGEDLGKEMSFSTIAASKYKRSGSEASSDLMALHGVRFIKTTEPARGQAINEALVKQLTGKSYISARELHAKQTSFRLTGKLAILTNHPPELDVTDQGLRRRIVVVPWNAKFRTGENRNLKMEEELSQEAEGILQWMVDGLGDYDLVGLDPSTCTAVAEATSKYLDARNPLQPALEAGYIELDPEAETAGQLLRDTLLEFFDEHPAARRLADDELSDALEVWGVTGRRTNHGRIWKGIRVRTAGVTTVTTQAVHAP
jgi:putative DNA primase/helicase